MNSATISCLTKEQVYDIGLAATTLEEIEQARKILRAWQAAHPE